MTPTRDHAAAVSESRLAPGPSHEGSFRGGLCRAGSAVVAMAAVGLVVGACGSDNSSGSDSAAESTPVTTSTPVSTSSTGASANAGSATYKDGTYSATGHYISPGGRQQVGVTVTLAKSVITTLSLDTSKTTGTSAEFQGKFKSGINNLVVGKNINDLNIHKVSGSSLTSGGFNDAIGQIKSEAKS